MSRPYYTYLTPNVYHSNNLYTNVHSTVVGVVERERIYDDGVN